MSYIQPQVLSSLLTHLTVLKMTIANHHDLSLRELLTLGVLATRGSVPFQELSIILSIPKSALTSLIDRLQTQGVVERRQHDRDRRRWFVTLTPSGQDLTQSIQREESRLIEPTLEEFSEAEREAFLKVIQALNSELVPQASRELARRGRVSKLKSRQKGRG